MFKPNTKKIIKLFGVTSGNKDDDGTPHFYLYKDIKTAQKNTYNNGMIYEATFTPHSILKVETKREFMPLPCTK